MNRVDDHILVRQSLQGDRKAFEEIVERYYKPIYNAAYRVVIDPDDAEDITQTVFIKAFEKLHNFNFDHRLFSWLYRIAINESLNVLRQKERFVRYDEETVRSENKLGESHDTGDLHRMIDQALQRLKLEYRTVVVLFHFQNLSYSEMSYILDIPEKTIKSRLFTARNLLKETLLKKHFDLHE